ncbi:Bro-N domain-containing protein [Zoogloea sp.]|uniref:BRO-N domain-containing protein n=1 Tax=Zoogloea sp. TaxID=49181 RepID=UPI0035ADFB7A
MCAALDFGNPRQALESHVDADDVQKLDTIDSLGRTQRANHVNESGLYALILGSTKDTAKRFKRWVTHDVLPTIRKTGGYAGRRDPRKPTPRRRQAGRRHHQGHRAQGSRRGPVACPASADPRRDLEAADRAEARGDYVRAVQGLIGIPAPPSTSSMTGRTTAPTSPNT